MTHDEQLDWIDARTQRSPYWAHQEFDIRRQAAEVMNRLYALDSALGVVKVAVSRPGMEYDYVTFYKRDVARIGGLEGVLLVEEMLRRAMGLA